MFREELKTKYPFLTDYFKRGIESETSSLSHSIVFYGQDSEAQYEFALEISRVLNCKENKNEDCQCLNCKWIREKTHPEVMTVTRIDNKPADDKTKTVISVAQARMVKNLLLNSSDYHRVIIFCDAYTQEGKWYPAPLNKENFQDETVNALLKSIEEPPENTTFFFLTRDKNDLIATVLSRSQSFYVPSLKKSDGGYSNIAGLMDDYPNIERKNSLDLAQELFELSKSCGCEKILDEIKNFLLAVLKSNIDNISLKSKIMTDIKNAELGKLKLEKYIQPQLVLEDFCLNLTK